MDSSYTLDVGQFCRVLSTDRPMESHRQIGRLAFLPVLSRAMGYRAQRFEIDTSCPGDSAYFQNKVSLQARINQPGLQCRVQ